MQELDCITALVKPTEICLEWINQLLSVDGNEPLSLEDITSDCTILLLPVFDNSQEMAEFIEDIYLDVFESELASWEEDERSWPKDLGFEQFLQWFKLEFHSMVYDFTDEIEKKDHITNIPSDEDYY